MIIKTKRLILKPVSSENNSAIARILANPAINKWIPALAGKTESQIATALEEYFTPNNLDYYAAIYMENAVVGIVSLEQDTNDDFYYIDIYIDSNYQRKGIASEAITEGLMEYVKSNPDIKKIGVNIASNNRNSLDMYNKLKDKALELNIEMKLAQGVSQYLWNNNKIRYAAYGAMTLGALGLCYLWNRYQQNTPISNNSIATLENTFKLEL